MRYNGKVEHSLDDKRRLQIPSKWRPESGEMTWIGVCWPKSGCLNVMSSDSYFEMIDTLEDRGRGDREARDLIRFLSVNSGDLAMDKAGRVMLPENLATAAGIVKDVTLVGAGREFEIWPREKYESAVPSAEIAELSFAKLLSKKKESVC
jgi:MraZ protein